MPSASKGSSPRISRRRHSSDEAGGSLIEILAALALTGLLVALFAPFVSQILGRWNTGADRSDIADRTMRATIRLQGEIAAAVPLRLAGRGDKQGVIAFAGRTDSCEFVRAVAETSGITLQDVALHVDDGSDRTSLIRRASRFDPQRFDTDPRALDAPIAVIAGPYRMRFAYVSRAGERTSDWLENDDLPARVELTLQPLDARTPLPAPIVMTLPMPPSLRPM